MKQPEESTASSILEEMDISNYDAATPILAEVTRLAREIEDWRLAQNPKLGIESLCRRFRDLSSSRSFERFRDGVEVESYRKSAQDWLAKYQRVHHQVQMAIHGATGYTAETYTELSSVVEVTTAVGLLVGQTGNTRLVVIDGNTGAGKTAALIALQTQLPGCIMATADPGWRSLGGALRELAIAVGATTRETADDDLPPSSAGKLAKIYGVLGTERRLILIDEAHELTGETLNIIKALINKTNCVIVIAAMDTLWKKLQANSWQEAKQLVLNRLFRRVRLNGPTLVDAQLFFLRRCGLSLPPSDYAIVVETSKQYGLYAFLRRVSDQILKGPDRDTSALTTATKDAITEVKTDRGGRN